MSRMTVALLPLLMTVPAAAQTAGGEGKATPLSPRTPPPTWVAGDDYPAEAMWEHATGVAAFRLDVGSDGDVKNCTILSSSGSEILDRETCRLLRLRATFNPSLDASGNPRTASFTSRFSWDLPEPSASLKSWTRVTTISISAEGQVGRCQLSYTGLPPDDNDARGCAAAKQMEPETIDALLGSPPKAIRLLLIEQYAPGSAGNTTAAIIPSGQEIYERKIRFDIDPKGEVANCIIVVDQGFDPLDSETYRCHPGVQYPVTPSGSRGASKSTIILVDTSDPRTTASTR